TGDRISGRTAVSTGAQSRAELRFSDNTLTRLGANSIFRMDQTTRTVDLEKGVILLQVPKQLGGAKVRTAAVTAAVTGTTLLLEFTPDGFIKIIVIEGEVDVSLNERRSQFRTLAAGDMWITRADDKKNLPLPVQVDLERLRKTSKLLNTDEFAPLGNQKQLQGALKDQGNKKLKGDLVNTSFQIEGRGRNVTLLLADRQHVVIEKPADPEEPPPPGPNKPINIAGTTQFDNQSTINTFSPSNAYNSIAGGFVPLPGSAYNPAKDGHFGKYMFDDSQEFLGLDELLAAKGSWFAMKGDTIYIAGSPAVDSSVGPKNLILGATGDVSFTANPPFDATGDGKGDRWTLDSNTGAFVFASLSGSINFDSFNLVGTNQDVTFYANGPSSDVNILGVPSALISLPEGTFEVVAGRDVRISAAAVEAPTIKMSAGRDLQLGAAKLAASGSIVLRAKQGVKISNSSELRSLSKLGNSQVVIEAMNGGIELVEGSSVGGDVVNVSSQRSDVRLVNSTIAAREIKARVFDAGGTLLLSNAILGRGTNASDLIRLYGEGAQGVRFVGDTTLRGNIVDIAGTSVTIDPGSLVRLSNPAGTSVYANSHNYNLETSGNFSGLSGVGTVDVNKQPYNKRPKY
ncbi:MAG: FecR domain-containing protein, partial [Opitutaceae bacterium]|nr:FecR domain-containing protein [Verrucomicrobiales bacterium]